MAFFEPPEPPPPPVPQPPTPPWFSAPEGMLPGVVALALVLAETDEHAICVTRLAAYPTGFAFELLTLSRSSEGVDPLLFGPQAAHRRRRPGASGELEPEQLRYGVQFSDGRKATNVEGYHGRPDGQPADGIRLHTRGGGGGGRSWHQDSWVWPLPPAGALAFVCEWPAAGIELSRREIDAAAVIDAATHARALFPGQDAGDGGAAQSRSVRVATTKHRA